MLWLLLGITGILLVLATRERSPRPAEARYKLVTTETRKRTLAPPASRSNGPVLRNAGNRPTTQSASTATTTQALISGRVVDETNHPVANASVLSAAAPSASASSAQINSGPLDQQTTTSSDGSFVIAHAIASTYTLAVYSDRHVPNLQEITAPARDLLIHLQSEGAAIEGRVLMLGTNTGVSSATVLLNTDRWSASRQAWRPMSVTSDDRGDFRMDRIPAGDYTLAAAKGRLQIFGRAPVVTLGEKETTSGLTMFLYPGHTVTGTVTEHDSGKPIAGVEVGNTPVFGATRTALTDANGSYRLEGLFGEWATLSVAKKGFCLYRPKLQEAIDTSAALPPDKFEVTKYFQMVPAVTVSGVVRLEAGAPAPGAVIKTISSTTLESLKHGLTCDAKGEYQFDVPPYLKLVVQATRDGYAPGFSETLDVQDKSVTASAIVLKPGGSVSGIVTDPSGAPVSGAAVTAEAIGRLSRFTWNSDVGTAVSTADGSFSIPQMPEGTVSLHAEKAGYTSSQEERLTLQAGEARTGVKLALKAPHFIAGKVTAANGKPMTDVFVFASGSDGSDGHARPDSSGKYRIEDLGPGTYRVSCASKAGRQSKEGVRADSDNVDFVLADKKTTDEGTFIGKVVDWKTKQPLRQFTAEVLFGDAKLEVDSAQPGRFVVTGPRTRFAFRLHITAPGCIDLDSKYLTIAPGDIPEEQEFVMGPGGTISGRAVEHGTTRPMPGVQVQLYDEDPSNDPVSGRMPRKTITTGADGIFSFELVRAGGSQVLFRPTSPLTPFLRTVQVENGVALDMGDVEMSGGGTITGRLLRLPGDQPIPDVKVTITESKLGTVFPCVTGADGSFRADKLAASRYYVSAPDLNAHSNVDLKDNETRDVVLRLGTGTLNGLVLQGGRPANRALIKLRQTDNDCEKNAFSDTDGRFKIEGLAQGPWNVSLSALPDTGGYARFIDAGAVEIANGEQERTFLLPAASIEGRVIDASGQPKSGIAVSVQCPPNVSDYKPTTVSSAGDGSFHFETLEPGQYALSANAGDAGSASATVSVVRDSPTRDVTLKLQKTPRPR